MESYQISQKKVLFYGAGTIANHLFHHLSGLDNCFYGFIDLRGDSLKEKNGFPVFTLEQCKEFSQKEDFVILITTRNIFEHSKIAHSFYDIGFRNLVFKHFLHLKGETNQIIEGIFQAHSVIHQDLKIPTEKIPVYSEKYTPQLKLSGIIDENQEKIKLYVPSSLLFTNGPVDYLPEMAVAHCHLASCYLAVDLYKVLGNSTPASQEIIRLYIDEIGKLGAELNGTDTSGDWEALILQARLDVYQQMNQSLAMDPDFFTRFPTTIAYNDKGQLSLVASGKNRVSFLIAKGLDYVPVFMEKSQFNRFLNENSLKLVEEMMRKQRIECFFSKILHPYFYDFPAIVPQYHQSFLNPLAHILGRNLIKETGFYRFSQLSFLTNLDDNGEASRFFAMLGGNSSSFATNELELALNSLANAEISSYQKESQYHVMVISNKIQNTLFHELLDKKPVVFVILQWKNGADYEPYLNDWEKTEVFSSVWQNEAVKATVFQRTTLLS